MGSKKWKVIMKLSLQVFLVLAAGGLGSQVSGAITMTMPPAEFQKLVADTTPCVVFKKGTGKSAQSYTMYDGIILTCKGECGQGTTTYEITDFEIED